MTIGLPGRQQWTPSGVSKVTVARVAAAVRGSMVGFVLLTVVTRHVGEGIGVNGQVALLGGVLAIAVPLAVRLGRGDSL